MALGAHWATQGKLEAVTSWADPGAVSPLLVVSGSCSPVTAGQIAWAQANGFTIVTLDPAAPDVSFASGQAVATMATGHSVVVCTSRGSTSGAPVSARILGTALGQIARTVVERAKVRRLVVAGGDTSSYAGRALGIEAVEMIAPLAPGAPLCRAFAPGSPADGLEINFKGGQVGAEDYFGAVARGKI
jgi:uncharacterized protein YgbK (DUF1537 family)